MLAIDNHLLGSVENWGRDVRIDPSTIAGRPSELRYRPLAAILEHLSNSFRQLKPHHANNSYRLWKKSQEENLSMDEKRAIED
jgi:hypothetical protein